MRGRGYIARFLFISGVALLVLGLVAGSSLFAAQAASSPRILVGLTRAAIVTLSSPAALTLGGTAAPVSPSPPVTVSAGIEVTLSATGSGISWGFTPPGGATQVGQSAGPVLLGTGQVTVKRLEGATTNVAGRAYRGSIVAIPAGGVVLLANVVDMEDYVQSTLGAEIPDGWHIESQKAQAIAVRSYAAYKVGLTRTGPPKDCEAQYCSVTEADVRLWSTDQVYRGIEEENPLSTAASRDTRGLVLAWNAAPAAAFFHSDAGGMTEEPPFVWEGGSQVPYLQAVPEVPHDSPYASWTVTLTGGQVSSCLGSLGIVPAPLPDIITGYGPGKSGRWTGVSVMTARGSEQVSATEFRRAFAQVRSMLFSSYSFGGGKETRGLLNAGLETYAQSSGSVAKVRLDNAVILGGSGATTPAIAGAYAITGGTHASALTYVLQGSGWGHGIGLSQYGAKAMAESGSSAAAILSRYYPGTALEQWW